MASKASLRAELRAKRRAYVAALSPDEKRRLLSALQERILSVSESPAVAAGYVAVGSEIDPAQTLSALAAAGASIALPRSSSPLQPISFHLSSPDVPLETGFAKIPQPPANAPTTAPDLVLVPLVAADFRRNRLGQGAGHYDRALSALHINGRCKTIGLAWDIQLIDELPTDPWDVPLDLVVTPTRIIG